MIDFKFDSALSSRELERVRDRFKKSYPAIDEQHEVEVQIVTDKATTKDNVVGFKMTSNSGSDLILFQNMNFATIRLAPYPGWDSLLIAMKSNFDEYTKIAGRKSVRRIGTRFINRIDLPLESIRDRDLSEIMNVGVALPAGVTQRTDAHNLTVQFAEKETGAKIRLRNATIEPALLDHLSILIDVDAFFDQDIPTRMDELWQHVGHLRAAKNKVFEACLSDEIRNLFS